MITEILNKCKCMDSLTCHYELMNNTIIIDAFI